MSRGEHFTDAARGSRSGQCYKLAAKHLLDNEHHGGVLVHGTAALDGGPRVPHAWVDEGPHIGVYEPENDMHMSQKDFRQRFHPEEHVRIESGAAALQAAQTGHWGPWR